MKTVIREIWQELSTPEVFRDDWYQWSSNQATHFVIGLSAAAGLSFLLYIVSGEFPIKWQVWSFIAVAYFLWEVEIQGWKGFDTIEDWLFVCIYGAGASLFLFTEIEPGRPELITSMQFVPLFMAIFWAHIVTGVVVRIWQKLRE